MPYVDPETNSLHAFGQRYRVALGKGGMLPADQKREGDGATPLGEWSLLALMLRPDRMKPPQTALPWRWIRPQDGWCDAADDPQYNRPVSLPYPASAERLWRDDHAYDLILVLDHNQHPVRSGAGSAIFWHVAQPDWRPTEGCVAMERAAFANLLPNLCSGMKLIIGPA